MKTNRVCLVALAALTVVALTGCSTTAEEVGDAIDQAHTAGASVSLATGLTLDGGLPSTSLDTSIVDALTELGDAESALTDLEPAPAEAGSRAGALERIRGVEDAVLILQAAVANGSDLAPGRDKLESALSGLEP